jgi:hypothetical protein
VLATCSLLDMLVSRYSSEALITALCSSTAHGLDAAGAPVAFAARRMGPQVCIYLAQWQQHI